MTVACEPVSIVFPGPVNPTRLRHEWLFSCLCGWRLALKTVVFDLDGTLADTSRDLIRAANRCFEARNHQGPLDPVADASTAFDGGRAMLRLGFSRLGESWSEADVDGEYPVFLEHYGRELDRETRLYPHAEEALDTLLSRDFLLAVCTNKPEALALELLRRLGVLDRFRSVLGADTLPVRKPNPIHLLETIRRAGGERTASVLVGDTDNDRATAKSAGVPCVLVTFGPRGLEVENLDPEWLLHDYRQLASLVDMAIGEIHAETGG